MSCCPPNSTPSFRDEYSPVGTKVSTPQVEFYAVGNPSAGGKAIIVIPDIYGWDSGRTRRIGDMLSAGVDAYVVIPKLFQPSFEGGTDGDALPPDFDLGGPRAGECWPWLAQFKYEGVIKPKIEALLAHLKELGVSSVGSVGFCWGGWCQAHLASEHPEIACLVTPHPSIHSIGGLLSENPLELVANVRSPWLLMPAGNDPPIYLPGGDVYERLKANNPACNAINFPDMNHGFASRGDVSIPNVNRDVEAFYAATESFLKEHLA